MQDIKVFNEEQLDAHYNKFKKYLTSYIKREGITEFIEWLDTTDMRVAPASTKYHGSFEGGLVVHNIYVFKRAIDVMNMIYPSFQQVDGEGNLMWQDEEKTIPVMTSKCPYSKESIALVTLLHDISKVDTYAIGQKKLPNKETGVWENTQYYYTKDQGERLLFGTHAENSLYILNKYFNLSYDEQLAILHHMGGLDFSDSDATRGNAVAAYRKSTLAYIVHMADMTAMILDEAV